MNAMNRKVKAEGNLLAFAAYTVPGTGKIRILDVVVIDSKHKLVDQCGGFHLVEVSEGRVTSNKVKQFVQGFTEACLQAQGIDARIPLENIKLRNLVELDAILADTDKYRAVRDLR